MKQEKPLYGGQAVVEGVMFAGKTHSVTAIRRTDGTIEYFSAPRRANPTLAAFKKSRLSAASSPLLKRAQPGPNICSLQANGMTSP